MMAKGVLSTISECTMFLTCLLASNRFIGRVDFLKSPPRIPPIINNEIKRNPIIENPK